MRVESLYRFNSITLEWWYRIRIFMAARLAINRCYVFKLILIMLSLVAVVVVVYKKLPLLFCWEITLSVLTWFSSSRYSQKTFASSLLHHCLKSSTTFFFMSSSSMWLTTNKNCACALLLRLLLKKLKRSIYQILCLLLRNRLISLGSRFVDGLFPMVIKK